MASRKPKPIEVKPISINPHAAHKPEDRPSWPEDSQELEDGQNSQEPVQQTLEEARAEEAASRDRDATSGHQGSDGDSQDPVTVRIKLKWTDAMKAAALNAIYDYRESAGAMPSILDLFEILQGDEAFAHLDGKTNHKGAPLFSSLSLQSGINAIRKRIAKDIANGDTEQAPLPSLARVQVERTKRVTDTRALGLLIAEREAKLKAAREAAGGQDSSEGDTGASSES